MRRIPHATRVETRRQRALVGIALLVIGLAPGCGVWNAMFGDPEGASGPDAYRHQAVVTPLDEAVTDDVSIGDGDQTDWRMIEIYDAGQLTFEMSVDEAEAALSLGVYDRYGTELQILEVPGGQVSTLAVDVGRGGRYFLRIRAESGPGTAYDLTITLGAPKARGSTKVPAGRPDF